MRKEHISRYQVNQNFQHHDPYPKQTISLELIAKQQSKKKVHENNHTTYTKDHTKAQ